MTSRERAERLVLDAARRVGLVGEIACEIDEAVAELRKGYLDIADALLPESEGAHQLVAEARGLRSAEINLRAQLAEVTKERDALLAVVDEAIRLLDISLTHIPVDRSGVAMALGDLIAAKAAKAVRP